MATPSSGLAAASQAGSNHRREPRPVTPGGDLWWGRQLCAGYGHS